MEPMLLKPVGKDNLWGGNRLKTEYNKDIPLTPLAETWECSAHPSGPSIIVNGQFAGSTMEVVLRQHDEFLGNRVDKKYGLPILIKFIDAEKDLSIQVHPDDDFARENENDFGKSEMWYVVDATDTASLVHGFAHDVNEAMLRQAVADGDLDKHLNKVHVHKGDVFYTPAGTIHGIGAGCLIAEIQESSDVTYRVYDYNRVDKNGQKRELHFAKAMRVLNMKTTAKYKQRARLVHYYPGCSREILCRCQYFETERITVTKGLAFTVMDTSFQVVLCINGCGGLETSEYKKPLRFKKGDCIFLPAGLGRCFIIGECEILKVRV
ncbi:MAG: class I mannose-6-phosphate isomerase [Phascolarctobacterium sp.]|uniref:type I phosphomannose isomerase catalytic subunit n=1 Tax=Phascolarctobacterium sp. TaxID=2049039 RepID=UPI0026DAD5ED|nr:type I phosphomannose isomerase catalytic subunit [Phascolarctobacterium sp.]MDO4921255.1 class I mannose-6-phosphate isomerase [Phascolarctobacterium sp.]